MAVTKCIQEGKAARIIRWTILGLSILAFIFSLVAVASCQFIENYYPCYGYSYSGYCSEKYNKVGIFKSDYPDCMKASSNSSARKGAKFCGVATVLLIFASITLILLAQLMQRKLKRTYTDCFWWTLRVLFICAVPLQAGTFALFEHYSSRSESITSQSLAPAGVIAAINCIILFVLAILSWLVGPKTGDDDKKDDDNNDVKGTKVEAPPQQGPLPPPATTEQVTVTVEKSAEGTKTTKEVIHPDGTKTITETFEPSSTTDLEATA